MSRKKMLTTTSQNHTFFAKLFINKSKTMKKNFKMKLFAYELQTNIFRLFFLWTISFSFKLVTTDRKHYNIDVNRQMLLKCCYICYLKPRNGFVYPCFVSFFVYYFGIGIQLIKNITYDMATESVKVRVSSPNGNRHLLQIVNVFVWLQWKDVWIDIKEAIGGIESVKEMFSATNVANFLQGYVNFVILKNLFVKCCPQYVADAL